MLGAIISDFGLVGIALSMMFVGLLIAVGVLGIWRPSSFPPGPTPLPFVGNITDISRGDTPLWILVGEMGKIYGDIFSIKLGTKWYVVLNSFETIQEGLVARPLDLSDRPHYYSTDIFSEDYRDLAYTNYSPTWVLHREFGLKSFRDASSNKQLDYAANEQFSVYVEPFLQSHGQGEPVNAIALGKLLAMGSVVTWCFGTDNEQLHRELVEIVSVGCSENLVGRRMPADIFPFLKYLPLSSNRVVRDVVSEFMRIIKTEFMRRRQVYNEDSKLTDLCAALIRAQKDVEKEKDYDFLTDVHVVQVMASSFRGAIGFLTTTYWGLATLAEYPDIQKEVTKEIRNVVGSERHPSLDDRDAMPYTAAFVMELLRFGSVASLGVPRSAHEDVKLNGYDIPKDTVILYNIYGTHFDEENFSEPDKFNPGRFLNADGSLNHPEKFIPFGMGLRKCLGYAQAQSFLFLIFCRLLQGYQVSKLVGDSQGDGSLLTQDPMILGSRWPKPFQVRVTKTE